MTSKALRVQSSSLRTMCCILAVLQSCEHNRLLRATCRYANVYSDVLLTYAAGIPVHALAMHKTKIKSPRLRNITVNSITLTLELLKLLAHTSYALNI